METGKVGKRVAPVTASAWQLTLTDGSRWLFDGDGRLVWQLTQHKKHNALRLTWGSIYGSTLANAAVGVDERVPTKIVDSAGRETKLGYDAITNRLEAIGGPGGALTLFSYDGDDPALETVRLLTKIEAGQMDWVRWIYGYKSGLLAKIVPPNADDKQAKSQFDLSYTLDARLNQATQPEVEQANESGDFKTADRRAYWVLSYQKSDRTSVADPQFFLTDYEHDPRRALVLRIRSPKVASQQQDLAYEYDGFRNLTSVRLRDGSRIGYQYHKGITGKWQHVGNNLWKITLPGKATYRWELYTPFNQPMRHEDPLGNTWYFTCDDAGNLTSVMHPRVPVVPSAADAVKFTVSGQGGVDTIGKVTEYLTHIYEKWTYLADGSGRVDTYTDSVGNQVKYSYDRLPGEPFSGLATGMETKDPKGRTALDKTRVQYDARGFISRFQDPGGVAAEVYERDLLGRVKRVAHSTRVTRLVFDKASNLIKVVLPNGATYVHKYDLLNRLTAIVDENMSGKSSPTRRFQYTERGELRRETDFKGNLVDYQTNALGWITEIRQPKKVNSRVTKYGYGPGGQVLTELDAGKTTDRITQYRYDGRGNLIRVIYPDKKLEQLLRYDLNDRLIASGLVYGQQLARGERLEYDALDRIRSVLHIDAPPGVNVATLDNKRAEGARTWYRYDANGNLRAVEDPLHHVWQTTYNGADLPVDFYDARGYITERRIYTPDGRVLMEQVPDPRISVNPVTAWRPPGTPYPQSDYFLVSRLYLDRNAWGEPRGILDANGGAAQLVYDAAGQVKTYRDTKGGLTEYERDHRNRVIRRKQHIGKKADSSIGLGTRVTEWRYDANDNLIRIYKPHEQGARDPKSYDAFTYDEEDLRTSYEAVPELAMDGATKTPRYRYTWSYNEFGELAAQIDPRGYRVRYVYDRNGNETKRWYDKALKRSDGSVADWIIQAGLDTKYRYGLTANDWKETRYKGQAGRWEPDPGKTHADLKKYACGYEDKLLRVECYWDAKDKDKSGWAKKKKRAYRWIGGDELHPEAISFVRAEHRLDGHLRPRSILVYDNASTPLKSHTDRISLDYDKGGRLHRLTDMEGSVFYTYNNNGDLERRAKRIVSQLRYGIKVKGGGHHWSGYIEQIDRTWESFGYDHADRIADYGKDRSIYFNEYIWDDEWEPEKQRSYPGSRFTKVAFGYRYLPYEAPARLSKKDQTDKREFISVHGLGNVVGDYERIGGKLKHLAAYVATEDTDTLIARIPAPGSVAKKQSGAVAPHLPAADLFHADALGSVIAVTDLAGAVSASQIYDAWGNKLSLVRKTGARETRYGFAGREEDRESDLMSFRARMYDPWTGRFIQKDPIDPTLDHYVYVDNRPGILVDRFGTAKQKKTTAKNRAAANRGKRKASSAATRKAARKTEHALARGVRQGGWRNRSYFRWLADKIDKGIEVVQKAQDLIRTARHPLQTAAEAGRGKAINQLVKTAARAGQGAVKGAKSVSLPGLVAETINLECDTPREFEGMLFCDMPPPWTRRYIREGFRPRRVLKPSWGPFEEGSDEWEFVKNTAPDPGLADLPRELSDLLRVQEPRVQVKEVVRNPCYRYVDAGMPDPSQAISSDCYQPRKQANRMHIPRTGYTGPGGAAWGRPTSGGGGDGYQKFPQATKLPPPSPPPKDAAPPGSGKGSGGGSGANGSGSKWGVCVSWPLPIPYPCVIGAGGSSPGSGGGGGWDYEKKVWIEY